MSEWDHKLPETPQNVIDLLARRIEVHDGWADSIERGDPGTEIAVAAGVGTIDSHRCYADQYRAAQEVIKRCTTS